jgi:hypothetical protein
MGGGDANAGGSTGGATGGQPTPADAAGGSPDGRSADAAPSPGGQPSDASPNLDAGDAGPVRPDARPPEPDGEPPPPDEGLRPDRRPPPPNCTDDDLDGYSIGGCTVEDCDDQSTEIYPGAPEVCDGLDNDCDGFPDDDYDFTSDVVHCGGCGISCLGREVPMICVAGACVPTGCPAGTWDLDGDPANGCEYACVPRPDGPEVCNGLDDDCDGLADEDFDLATDPENCGGCGVRCQGDHAVMVCVGVPPACAVGGCDDTFWDVDGDGSNGCEYQCLPTREGVEHCDLIDNDCDGAIDEAEPERGFACPAP